jgi:hypothetical protein
MARHFHRLRGRQSLAAIGQELPATANCRRWRIQYPTPNTPSHTGINQTDKRISGVKNIITKIPAKNAKHNQFVTG